MANHKSIRAQFNNRSSALPKLKTLMSPKPLRIIGELMNNSYARAREAFTDRNPRRLPEFARIQTELGAAFLTLNWMARNASR